jgi:hypothetical protein
MDDVEWEMTNNNKMKNNGSTHSWMMMLAMYVPFTKHIPGK